MHRSTHGATVFDNHMLGAAKYERPTVFDMHAWQSKYAQSNRFLHACSAQRSMHGATVFDKPCSVLRSKHRACMLGSSKYARSNRFIGMIGAAKYARSNRFYMHARCSKVCTEQPFFICMLGAAKYARSNRFLYACSVQRSMHGATVFICMLGAAKYAQSTRL